MSAFTPEQWAKAGEFALRAAMAECGTEKPSEADIAAARAGAVHIATGCTDHAAKASIVGRARSGSLRAPWLCRIGLHRWKPVYRPGWFTFPITGVRSAFSGPGWLDFGWKLIGAKCRRCGKAAHHD